MTKLLIVESPNKVKKLKAILGEGWNVTASVGHIRDLPPHELGFAPPDFKGNYVALPDKEEVIKNLKRMAKNIPSENIYIATDPDREGEGIAWHIAQVLAIQNPQRVTFQEITEAAIKKAVTMPRKLDLYLVAAQQMRRFLDRAVGYQVSPLIRQHTGQSLSAGRVQSVAVRLLVERERDIANFKTVTHYATRLHFDEWFADWQVKDWLNDQEYLTDRNLAEQIAQIPQVTVTAFDESNRRKAPPPAFTTSTLQQAASIALKFSPKQTMDLAQKLFAAGHISYHRTDSSGLSDEALQAIHAIASSKGLPVSDKPRQGKAGANAQEAHEAIRPTHFEIEAVPESDDEQALYKLIWLRAVASQLTDAIYSVRTVELTGISEGKKAVFVGKGEKLEKSGWLSLTNDSTNEDEAQEQNPLPLLTTGQDLQVSSAEVRELRTKPKPRFTEAALVRKLESEGVGRPSTYASIMERIKTHGYMTIDAKGKIIATAKGMTINDELLPFYQFMNIDFTKKIEETLDLLANGKASYKQCLNEFFNQLQIENMNYTKNAIQVFTENARHFCEICKRPLKRYESSFSKDSYYWRCIGYEMKKEIDGVIIHECNSPALSDFDGEPKAKEKPVLSEFKCLACSSPLIKRESKNGGHFWACSGFPKCKATYQDNEGTPAEPKKLVSSDITCPKCSKHPLVQRGNDSNVFWGCQSYPKCKFTASDDNGKPSITDEMLEKIKADKPPSKPRTVRTNKRLG